MLRIYLLCPKPFCVLWFFKGGATIAWFLPPRSHRMPRFVLWTRWLCIKLITYPPCVRPFRVPRLFKGVPHHCVVGCFLWLKHLSCAERFASAIASPQHWRISEGGRREARSLFLHGVVEHVLQLGYRDDDILLPPSLASEDSRCSWVRGGSGSGEQSLLYWIILAAITYWLRLLLMFLI